MMNLLLAINTEKKTTCDAGCAGRRFSRTAPRQVVGRGTRRRLLGRCAVGPAWSVGIRAGQRRACAAGSRKSRGVSTVESLGSTLEYPERARTERLLWSPFAVPWSPLKGRAPAGEGGREQLGGRGGTWQYRRRGRATAWARYPSAWLPLRLGAATRNVQAECISTYSRHLRRVAAACGCSCVMVTHNPQVECYADRVLFMQVGPSVYRRM